MNFVRLLSIPALAVLAAAGLARSHAAPVTYWFSGVVNGFVNASNAAPAGVAVGAPFVGRVSYDPSAVSYAETNNAGGGVNAQYHYGSTTGLSFAVYIAGQWISNTVNLGNSGQIGIENDVHGRDFYYADSSSTLLLNGTNMVAAPNQSSMTLALFDENKTALPSVALPLAAPVLNQFSYRVFTLSARNSNGTKDLCSISGPISVIRTNEIVLLSLRRTSSSAGQVAWPLWANGYTLQSATSLTAPNWQTVATPVVNLGQEHTVSVPTTGAPRFYRLRK